MTAAEHSLLPTTQHGWRDLLQRLSIRPSKGLGQHFLFERGVVDRLIRAAEIRQDELVVEVGPGLGILTEALLNRGASVFAIELDHRLATHLDQAFHRDANLTVIEADALNVDLATILPPGQPFDVAANLPYSSGTAILRHLLEQPRRPRRLAIMVQREVAERLVAEPPDMTILGVATRFYATARIAFVVSPSVFIPPPKVESAVVILDVRKDLALGPDQQPAFFQLVNAGFRQKRKQLANTLATELDQPKLDVVKWLQAANVAPDRRPQTLTLEEWIALTRRAPAGWLR